MQGVMIIGGLSLCGALILYLVGRQWFRFTGYMCDEEGHLDSSANGFLIKMCVVLGVAPIIVEVLIKVGIL